MTYKRRAPTSLYVMGCTFSLSCWSFAAGRHLLLSGTSCTQNTESVLHMKEMLRVTCFWSGKLVSLGFHGDSIGKQLAKELTWLRHTQTKKYRGTGLASPCRLWRSVSSSPIPDAGTSVTCLSPTDRQTAACFTINRKILLSGLSLILCMLDTKLPIHHTGHTNNCITIQYLQSHSSHNQLSPEPVNTNSVLLQWSTEL